MLATLNEDGTPHLVPITFCLEGDVIASVVDDKPKRTRALKRLANIARDPRVSVLVHHYDEDWSKLWWCRGSGIAEVGDGPPPSALVERYPAYEEREPSGPVVSVEIHAWTGWRAD